MEKAITNQIEALNKINSDDNQNFLFFENKRNEMNFKMLNYLPERMRSASDGAPEALSASSI